MHKEIEVISGYKFAEISDIIFSGTFLKSQRESLYRKDNVKDNSNEHFISGQYINIRTKNFKLKENDIIFCKTDYIYELFSILKNSANLKI